MLTREHICQHGVYFLVPERAFDANKTHHVLACLAEGLVQLGVPCSSNVQHELFSQRDLRPGGPEIYVFHVGEEGHSVALHQAIASFDARYRLVMSMADTAHGIFTPPDIPCLITHENSFRRVVGRRVPWAFGLSRAMLTATAGGRPLPQREQFLLRNFRPSANQSVRNALDLALLPHLEKHFSIDRTIGPDHFERLQRAVGCLAYGGMFDESLMANEFFARQPALQEHYGRITYLRPITVVRWDSWRWWESLASGCLTLHLDFAQYGLQLPVMPVAMQHYVPVDFADPKGSVDRLMDARPRWEEIANQGRDWARAHYSPDAVAERFLQGATTEWFTASR